MRGAGSDLVVQPAGQLVEPVPVAGPDRRRPVGLARLEHDLPGQEKLAGRQHGLTVVEPLRGLHWLPDHARWRPHTSPDSQPKPASPATSTRGESCPWLPARLSTSVAAAETPLPRRWIRVAVMSPA